MQLFSKIHVAVNLGTPSLLQSSEAGQGLGSYISYLGTPCITSSKPKVLHTDVYEQASSKRDDVQ